MVFPLKDAQNLMAREKAVTDKQSERLESLKKRIRVAKETQNPKVAAPEHYTMANMAWRMVIELVAGIVIGFGIGYGADVLFGTMPLFLILFIGLGLAAGIKTMMRTAAEVQQMDKKEEGADLGRKNE